MFLITSFILTIPWLFCLVSGTTLPLFYKVTFTGGAIIGAGYILSENAEIAQLEVSRALAIATIALIAVLPEYVVDLYFAWMAAHHPEYGAYASANMTGANRLLIGFGWPLIMFLYLLFTGKKHLKLGESYRLELRTLLIATLYAFIIPLKGNLSLIDFLILGGMYVVYAYRTGKSPHEEVESPTFFFQFVKTRERTVRILIITLGFLYGGFIIFTSAEPFGESLLKVAEHLQIEKFLLVQWIAPLASEAPELIIASIFVFKKKAGHGLGILISSKVNQWTLLVGCISLIYSISGKSITPLHLDGRQIEEIFLTASQSLFAVILLAELDITLFEGFILLILFFTQLLIPNPHTRMMFAWGYLVLFLLFMIGRKKRKGFFNLLKSLK